MTGRLRLQLEEASKLKLEYDKLASIKGGFAYQLASLSMASHIDDLAQQCAIETSSLAFEHVEMRLKASKFADGSAPLELVAKISNSFRQMVGYAALRLKHGGIEKKKIPKRLYQDLDLRMLGLLPGSTRFVISANSNRDLFGDGIAKGCFERIFRLLLSNGDGEEFTEAVADLGPKSSIHLRSLLDLIIGEAADVEISWRFRGQQVYSWNADRRLLGRISSALAATEVKESEEAIISGTVELLSKRERIQLVSPEGARYRILYPKCLLPAVSELRLDQIVNLRCAVSEIVNPLTQEHPKSYELLGIVD